MCCEGQPRVGGGKVFVTDEWLDALQDEVAGDAAREVLTQLRDEFGVAFVLFPQQVELLLLVTKNNTDTRQLKIYRADRTTKPPPRVSPHLQ